VARRLLSYTRVPRLYKKPTRAVLIAGIAAALVFIAAGGLWLASQAYRPAALKQRIEALLSDQLESEVTLETLDGSFFPRVALSGSGLVVRHHGRTDVPPLLRIEHFEIRASLRQLMSRPRHVSEVRLQGLQVHIPPGDDDRDDDDKQRPEQTQKEDPLHEVIIDRFEAPDTVLTLIPKKPNKPPKVFTIHHLVMDTVGRGYKVPYIAVLTNPVPKGDIETSGTFGPWNIARPARTPVSGKYVFANADLNTIEGLAGVLSSEGTFDGPLNRIHVQGTTDTPKFQVDAGGQAVPLKTRFSAFVDGSDGDTILDNVDARFLNTEMNAKGAVIGFEGVQGRQIEVDVRVNNGRVEDLLRLAVDSPKPILRGAVQFAAKLVIPPRKAKVLDKMSLRGAFGLTGAKFTDSSVQSKIIGLSRHGQGKKADEPVGEVMSDLRGKFAIDNAVASFPELKFGVPGALVDLSGRYAMRTQDMDFHGHLVMDATLSEAAGGGLKSFFLKAVDPFFKKNGKGAVVPIKITGNRKDPKFGLDLFKKN
jgi:hypothetical protein